MYVRVPAAKRRVAADQRYLTYDQAARRAGVSKRTVQSWVYDGKLEAVRTTERLVRIDIEVLDAFLAA